MRQSLLRYKHIIRVNNLHECWEEVEAECQEDPEGLALRLADKGAVSTALEVAESSGLSINLRRELQGRQLIKLLTADQLNGGGPAEASLFFVHFFLKRREGKLSNIEVSRLNSWASGLRVLAALALPWQQRYFSLHEHPHLILEVLLMRKQFQSASLIFKEFPSLRDNSSLFAYAAKAIAISVASPSREHRIPISGARPKQKMRTGTLHIYGVLNYVIFFVLNNLKRGKANGCSELYSSEWQINLGYVL